MPLQIRSPKSGERLVTSGPARGVHDSIRAGGTPVPSFTTLPSFRTPIAATVGSVVEIDNLGVRSPATALVTVTIGAGTNLANFEAYINGTSGTIPAAMLGRPLAMRATIAVGRIVRAIVIPAGVTITGTEPVGFPADLDSDDWTSVEIRTGSLAGRRRVTLSPGVVVPAGYELRWYSGMVSGAVGFENTASTTKLDPGNTYDTSGTIPIGSTVYNLFFWRRLSDGAMRMAHPLAEQVSFDILGLIEPPNPPGDPNFTPDATFDTAAKVRAQIVAWLADWAGTIPVGKTASSDRVIGINASTSGTFDLSNLINNNATKISGRIFVRAVGTFTDFDCTVRHTGRFNMNGSRGIWACLMRLISGQNVGWGSGISADSTTLCGFTRCILDAEGAAWNPQATAPTYLFALSANAFTDLTVSHCLLRGGSEATAVFGSFNGLDLVGNVFDYPNHDDVKFTGVCSNLVDYRNWSARRHSCIGGDVHEDTRQHQGTAMYGYSAWGNVYLPGHGNQHAGFNNPQYYKGAAFGATTDPAAYWYPAVTTGKAWWFINPTPYANQGIFFQGEPANQGATLAVSNIRIEQNIIFCDNNAYKFTNGVGWTGSDYCRDNLAGMVGRQNSSGGIIGGYQRARNFVAAGKNNTEPAGVGAGGVQIYVGTWTARDYSSYLSHFATIPFMSQSGQMKATPDPISVIQPLTTSPLHWAPRAVGSLTQSGGVATVTVGSTAGLEVGMQVTIVGATPAAYNGAKTIVAIPNATTFTFAVASGTVTPATGTITYTPNVGPQIRYREIFDPAFRAQRDTAAGYKVVPGDQGWPVAGTWEITYNANGAVPTSHTGVYDTSGGNA